MKIHFSRFRTKREPHSTLDFGGRLSKQTTVVGIVSYTAIRIKCIE